MPQPGETVNKWAPGGMAQFYDDSWLPLLKFLQPAGQGAGTASAFLTALQNFKGSEKDLERWLRWSAPFMASGLATTGAFKDLQDYQQRSNAIMQQFGPAAGRIGAAQTEGVRRGQQQLGRAGLGQSGARAALSSQAALAAGGQQADIFTQLHQGSLAARQQMAGQAFDAQRQIATLALGYNPQPRQKQQSSSPWGAIGALGGAALGSIIPGVGTALGGLLGGGVGAGAGPAVTPSSSGWGF